MKNLNFNVAICKSFDDETKTATEFVNEIKVQNNKANITFFCMISGCGESKQMQFDFVLIAIDVEHKEYNQKGSYLFSLTMKREEVDSKEHLKSIMGSNAFQEIGAYSREVKFPGKGYYELAVYLVTEKNKEEMDRMKIYAEEGTSPIATYAFRAC